MRLSAYIMFFADSLSATHAKHAESEHSCSQITQQYEQTMKLVDCVRGIFRIFLELYHGTVCQVHTVHRPFMMFPIYFDDLCLAVPSIYR